MYFWIVVTISAFACHISVVDAEECLTVITEACQRRTEMDPGFEEYYQSGSDYCFIDGSDNVCFMATDGSTREKCDCSYTACGCTSAPHNLIPTPTPAPAPHNLIPTPTPAPAPAPAAQTCETLNPGQSCLNKKDVGTAYHSIFTTGDYCFDYGGMKSCFFTPNGATLPCDCKTACDCEGKGSTYIKPTCKHEVAKITNWEKKYCQPVLHGYENNNNTYCHFTSMNPSLEMCKFGFTQAQKDHILSLHNQYRTFVAQGKETRGSPGPQPAATDMNMLAWDNELEEGALRWASQGIDNPPHDHQRTTDSYPYVGQNAYRAWHVAEFPDFRIQEAMQGWYDEVALLNKDEVDGFVFSEATGHYTQLVWADTTHVGCSGANFVNNAYPDNPYRQAIICNYGPSGNAEGKPLYTKA